MSSAPALSRGIVAMGRHGLGRPTSRPNNSGKLIDESRFEVSQAATRSEGLTLLRDLNYGISLILVHWNIRANSGIDNRSCPPFRPASHPHP